MSSATIELTAPDISCDKCRANIEGDLAGDPGVEQVTVDTGTRRVLIEYDEDLTSPQQLRARLSEIGTRLIPDRKGRQPPRWDRR